MSRTYPLGFYNIDNNRDPDQVAREVLAFLNGPRLAVLGLCETTDIGLPDHPDYRKITDNSRPGRDNISAYVKLSLEFSDKQWHDCSETWTRTEHPGTHPARSWLEFRAGKMQVLIGHQPPKGTDNTWDAQQEGIDLCTRRMAPWTRSDWDDRTDEDKQNAKQQARVTLADWNRKPGEDGPGPTMLANRIDGGTVGHRIDAAVKRKCSAYGVSYPTQVNGVQLCSDHDCAFLFDLTVD